MKMLRFATVGSVDDGKSTLIGRLLYDSKSIFEDQIEHLQAIRERTGSDGVDLALVTDGLRAEREQGITIDVAYRYFATPKRKFIVADCPGHIQYTRNMITGASTVDLAVLLIDARFGVVEQTKRHSLLASLLGVPHVVICVNKMDLVDFDERVYDSICDDYREFASRLRLHDVSFIPISALKGDNVVERSAQMSWYEGGSLLHHLESVYIAGDTNQIDVRFPVQYVIRPQSAEHPDYRGYAGRVAGGVLRPGDDVVILPSGFSTRITAIDTYLGPRDEARPGDSVTLCLEDDIDISRGDMICRPQNRPDIGQNLEAMIAWMDHSSSLEEGKLYALKHTTRTVRCKVGEIRYRLDINSLHREPSASSLVANEVGRVALRTSEPLMYDEYQTNRSTGSFILIDESTHQTVAGGMLLRPKAPQA